MKKDKSRLMPRAAGSPGGGGSRGYSSPGSGAAAPGSSGSPREANAKLKALKIIAKLTATTDVARRAKLQAKLDRVLSKAGASSTSTSTSTITSTASAAVNPTRATLATLATPGIPKGAPFGKAAARKQPALPALQASTPEEQVLRAQRAARFADDLAARELAAAGGARVGASAPAPPRLLDERARGGYGTNSCLEKEYLRLTSLPLAADVRPPKVLQQALDMVKSRWAGGCSYHYACQQLKAIRQDLTVQGIDDGLAVHAYETHARISIEVCDEAEFRQCLAVLRRLYLLGSAGNAPEFHAYGVLHAAAQGGQVLVQELAALPEELLRHEFVAHAMAAARAARAGSWLRFLRLYRSAPRMAPYLMDVMLPRLRRYALRALVAAHAPLPLDYVALQLGLEGPAQAAEFCTANGAVVDSRNEVLDTRASRAVASGPPRPPPP